MIPKSEKLLVAWYGDDFTGSAAVLEVLSFAGVNAMLFLEAPTDEQLARYSDLQAVGVASTARAQSPDWMKSFLPKPFEALQKLGPELMHYKICTTLDSSPVIGSIGCVIEIAADLFSPESVPVLVAAPQMRRYQVFGHLFAAFGSKTYRIDRHPVMACHPVTPITESDVALHIAAQSERLEMSLCSLEMLATDQQISSTESLQAERITQTDSISVFTIDCADEGSELAAGRLLWKQRDKNPFVVGSQGVEYALVRHWIETGTLLPQEPPGSAGASQAMVTVSGSVSPTTAEQIDWARRHGFMAIHFDVVQACFSPSELEVEIARVVKESCAALAANTDPLIYTAEGPEDPAVHKLVEVVSKAGLNMSDVNQKIGAALGSALRKILSQSKARRIIVSGGDTSGHVIQALGIFALSALAPTVPGASLSRAHADGPLDGLEVALKGGQMGSSDYFGWIRDGGGVR